MEGKRQENSATKPTYHQPIFQPYPPVFLQKNRDAILAKKLLRYIIDFFFRRRTAVVNSSRENGAETLQEILAHIQKLT
ncbi:hypothetical protein DN752_03920 [Echinicola strongylocentroti]|uniref:Uncharacterized protein n=1 Tax=Echinicola strongylocentroti TaxID=1795355 RepID=A0A2Z4IF09_9BACT|nr:hypothetical protein DN752_03920 [Echinicola strongylocentroti]